MYTKSLSKLEYDRFYELLEGYELPSYRVGESAAAGTDHNSFKIVLSDSVTVDDTDTHPDLLVTLLNESGSGVVNQDEPEKVEGSAVIRSRSQRTAWFLPASLVDESGQLPELRQAFYEGHFDERDADFKYHFPNGDEVTAVPASDPVQRLDKEITITGVQYMGGEFPKQFVLETDEGDALYLRERAGTIRLYNEDRSGDLLFYAQVGGEHPGTPLYKEEVVDFINSVEYITITDSAMENEVSETAKEEYWGTTELDSE